MTRTTSLAFLRFALVATMVGTTGVALAQRSTHSEWTSTEDDAGDEWKPTRSAAAAPKAANPAATSRASASQPAKWIMPTQGGKPNRPAAKTAAREPQPFSPPADAEELAESITAAKSNPNTTSGSRPNSGKGSAAVAAKAKPMPRTQAERVAHRPRPAAAGNRPSFTSRMFDEGWMNPLKQVAYHADEPEELHAPPSERGSAPDDPLLMTSPMASDGEWIGGCNDGSCSLDGCGPMCGDSVGCQNCEPDTLDLCTIGPHDDESCDTLRIRIPKFQELMIFGGVHGFKGPFDRARDSGNFGFQEGFNVGAKIPFSDTGYQFGYQAQQSQLSGDADTGITSSFSQHFFTTGVFRRARDGFQGGIVWDLLLDERETSVGFSQVRAELGFVDCGCHEIGAMMAVHLDNNVFADIQGQTTTAFQSVDQYLLYYRMHGPRGGEGRIYGGFTDNADALIGSDFMLPLTDSFSLQPAFTYLIPDGSDTTHAAREEAWNISISLVWHWRGHARSCHSSPYRPLFNVADNGYMIIDNRP